MQENPKHSQAFDYFIAFLREAVRDKNLSEPIIEVLTPLFKESFSVLMRDAVLSGNISRLKNGQPLNGKIFIPFDKWQNGEDTLNEFYRVFTRDGFLRHCKDDRLNPDFVSIDAQTVKVVWEGTIPELIYTSHRLMHTYNAIPGASNYSLVLWENYLIPDKKTGNPISSDIKSLRTKYSQIVKEITDKKRVHEDIDRLFYEIFKNKKVDCKLIKS